MTRRTLSSGSTIAASRGKPSTSSRTRASYRERLATPTFKPKLRSVPRKSDSTSSSLRCSSLRLVSSMRCSWATSVFTCTGLNRPTRIICAIPRASLRSVLLIRCAVSRALHVPRIHADHRQVGRRQRIDQPLRQRTSLDPDPTVGHGERAQKGDDIGRLGRYFLLQDHPAGIVDNANRRFLHRHIKANEMRHLIAPSSMLEVTPTTEGDAHSSSKREPQPPRYTIFSTSPTIRWRSDEDRLRVDLSG